MLIFSAGWQPEMSLWESDSTNGGIGENVKPPVRLFNIFLMSQVSAVGQRRYNLCPGNIKSVQQCMQCKIWCQAECDCQKQDSQYHHTALPLFPSA